MFNEDYDNTGILKYIRYFIRNNIPFDVNTSKEYIHFPFGDEEYTVKNDKMYIVFIIHNLRDGTRRMYCVSKDNIISVSTDNYMDE